MNLCVVSIADSVVLAGALSRFVSLTLGPETESYFTTYDRNWLLLNRGVYLRSDLFVLSLMRWYGSSPRAEGLYVAEMLYEHGKRALIVSGSAHCEQVDSPIYWDLRSQVGLRDRIRQVLVQSTPDEDHRNGFARLKEVFRPYCRLPPHNHGHAGSLRQEKVAP
jgi:hypothetical protein